MSGDTLLAIALVLAVGAAVILTLGLDAIHWLKGWLSQQAIDAEARRIMRATRKSAPLLSINLPFWRSHYVTNNDAAEAERPGTQYQHAPDTAAVVPASTQAASTSTGPAEQTIATEVELAKHLATLRKPSGSYWLSANKIFVAVGGERESVLAAVREVRGREVQPNERMLMIDGKRQITWEP